LGQPIHDISKPHVELSGPWKIGKHKHHATSPINHGESSHQYEGVNSMNARPSNVAVATNDNGDSTSAVAVRLVEAACLARGGNCEAAKAHIARALALLRGDPSTLPESTPAREYGASGAVWVGLAAWKKRRLAAYIDAHLADRIRVCDLAELLDLSNSHFCRVFGGAFGTSPHDYVTRRRIEAAQALMLTTSDALCTIAYRCGFSDQSHFIRVFRRIVRETPSAWRRIRRDVFDAEMPDTSGNAAESGSVSFPFSRTDSPN